jgi:hypothetical protein
MLHASPAYVRRLLASQRLFGIKVGPVWGVYAEDVESFMRGRRPPGRPRRAATRPLGEDDTRDRITTERAAAGTDESLLRPKTGA